MIAKEMTPEEKKRRQKKCVSVRKLAEQIHILRRKVSQDLKSDDEKTQLKALAVALMDKTTERVGNEASAKDGHVGVTGFRPKHISIEGKKVRLKYVGKSGVDHEKEFADSFIAGLLKKLKGRNKGKTLLTTEDGFQVKADAVNRYLKDFGITAKDIRGYGANTLVVNALNSAEKSSDKDERKKKFREVLKSVAERVGHQQATLKTHYLLPGLEEQYVGKGKVLSVKEAADVGWERRMVSRLAIEKSIVEDAWPVIPFEARVRQAIGHWLIARTYVNLWDGLEKFCLALASEVDSVAIQNISPNGTTWRYVVTDGWTSWHVVVNCSVIYHNGVWQFMASTYSAPNMDFLEDDVLHHHDPWLRSMKWAVETAKMLTHFPFFVNDTRVALGDMEIRVKLAEPAWKLADDLIESLTLTCAKKLGRKSQIPGQMTIAINDWDLPIGKVGSYRFPGEFPFGILTLNREAAGNDKLRNSVMKHELIHAALGQESESHGEEFQLLSDAYGIPKEYQD